MAPQSRLLGRRAKRIMLAMIFGSLILLVFTMNRWIRLTRVADRFQGGHPSKFKANPQAAVDQDHPEWQNSSRIDVTRQTTGSRTIVDQPNTLVTEGAAVAMNKTKDLNSPLSNAQDEDNAPMRLVESKASDHGSAHIAPNELNAHSSFVETRNAERLKDSDENNYDGPGSAPQCSNPELSVSLVKTAPINGSNPSVSSRADLQSDLRRVELLSEHTFCHTPANCLPAMRGKWFMFMGDSVSKAAVANP
jgi:hypothetical protein